MARGSYRIHLKKDGSETVFPVSLGVTGRHNISNSMAAIAIAYLLLGGEPDAICEALKASVVPTDGSSIRASFLRQL